MKVVFLAIGCLMASRAEDSPFGLADLEAYRSALSAKLDGSAPTVGFKDLWDRPGDYAGKAVAVEGRVARLFRQPKVGEFPPLVEAWVVSAAGDPFCLVFPQLEGRTSPGVGSQVRFSGTFLKRIKYQGGDVDRLAPLIVGPETPATPRPGSDLEGMKWNSVDWMMALGACLVVGLLLARRHLARPTPVPRRVEPPPSFVDGKPEAGGDWDEIA
jgi:hypothetical protein